MGSRFRNSPQTFQRFVDQEILNGTETISKVGKLPTLLVVSVFR